MCFTKSASSAPPIVEPEPVIRHEADADVTKKSKGNDGGFRQNILTSAYGIDQQAKTTKKTLLGE